MLLQSYGTIEGVEPLPQWAPEAIQAHIAFQRRLNDELTERGELIDAQALTGPEAARLVTYGGTGEPVVTDGPFPETKELLAGWRIIDVESLERAIEVAAQVSAAPGPKGLPIKQPIELREVMAPLGPEA
jgi:hypothetical protein